MLAKNKQPPLNSSNNSSTYKVKKKVNASSEQTTVMGIVCFPQSHKHSKLPATTNCTRDTLPKCTRRMPEPHPGESDEVHSTCR